MTDAYVSRNVSNITDTTTTSQVEENTKRNNNTNDENCLSVTVTSNLKCNCNETSEPKLETQTQSFNMSSSNSSKNDSLTNSKDDSQKTQVVVTGEGDPNSVLKYVYKKNEGKDVPTKTTGHPKNALRRRKRSENSEKLEGTKAPLIVNYETSHGPQRDVEVWLPARNTENVIKHSALADFNIETLHDNEPAKETIPKNAKDSNESVDRENERNNDVSSGSNSEESREQNVESSENSSENEQSKINYEKYPQPQENYRNKDSSDEHDRKSSLELDNTDDNSRENTDSKEYPQSKYTTSPNRENTSAENSSEENEKSDVLYPKNENINSEELNSKYQTEGRDQYNSDEKNGRPETIKDVDLGEYERIQVNEDGQIEVAKDAHENTAFDPNLDIILTTKPINEVKKSEKISSLAKSNTDSTSLESHENSEPTHINDGEVKPVVEINSEGDSNESNDEESNEALKAKLENESLETLTGVNDKDSNEKSDKLQEDTSHNQGDVKQQFERIPLNYNHAEKKQSKDGELEKEAKEDVTDIENNEGTIDKVKPRYDENLNIKFDEISIKLPEIKLPDDILSYAYENPPVYKDVQQSKPSHFHDNSKNEKNNNEERERPTYYHDTSIYNKDKEEQVEKPTNFRNNKKEEEKPRFYHYSDEVEDEPRARVKQEDDDNSNDNRNDYYGYHPEENKKDNYKQKQNNDEQEDDDLYEKFVRERFGKRGSFEKRLEKLTDYKSQNPHLYQKVQNILKKTKDVKSEAEKSGDPNAGYMWTLEYGEKL